MTTYLKDLIHIPEKIYKGDFVLKLAEGVDKPEQTLNDYVVTPQLQECFREALSFVKSALETNSSKMTYLHGSFGSGKSHFMAVLDFILSNHKAARNKKDLQEICLANLWTENYKLLMVPYHMIGASSLEEAILSQYTSFVKKLHPEAKSPAVYLAEGLFENVDVYRQNISDEQFFAMLNGGEDAEEDDDGFGYDIGWDAESFEEARKSPPGSAEWRRLVEDLVTYAFPGHGHLTAGKGEAYLPLDQGLSVISHHAKELGYDGIILFLDELILWLASRAADMSFVHQEAQKLAKLVEAQEASRPIPLVSFIARQRDLRELVGENVTGAEQLNFDDGSRHGGGRFSKITLEDMNLPDIVAGRVLRPKSQTAVDQISEAFETNSRVRQEVMDVLLTSHGDREMFRKVYPFSPALIETLVAASSLLQRNRTAIKALMELLVRQRDQLTLGSVVPVGDLFDIVSDGDEVFTQGMREHFNNAKRLYHERFRPMLESEYHISESAALNPGGIEDPETLRNAERYRNDARLVKTLLLSSLVPGVESFRALTPQRLAALNHGTISTPLPGQEGTVVLRKLRNWAAEIGELRISEGSNPTVTLQLVGIDVQRILEYSKHIDNAGNRKKKIRELVLEATGITSMELMNTHTMLWRGTQREFPVEFANVREKTLDSLRNTSDGWQLLIDFPFDQQEFGPRDDLAKLDQFRKNGENSKTLVWLPQFLSTKVQTELGRLVMLEHVLSGDNFKQATVHLAPQDVPQAQSLLENQRSALRRRLMGDLDMAYGITSRLEDDVINTAISLEQSEQFQSLWGGFTPRVPVGANLKEALEDLLAQALGTDFPGHPKFEVESRITVSQVKSVWDELSRLSQAGGERLEIDKKFRPRMRAIAQPLKLGQMAETHFVSSRHWLDEFDKRSSLEGLQEPTVRDLDRWMDDKNPTGLPSELRDLVVMSFAIRTNRSFKLRGVSYEPQIGRISRDATLVVQAMPSESDWEAARVLVEKLFELRTISLLNADTVSRFAEHAKELAAQNRQAVQDLPGALAEGLAGLGLKAGDCPRLKAAHEARRVLEVFSGEQEPKTLVEALSSLSLKVSPQELARSVHTAASNLKALRETRLDVFELLRERETAEAEAIRTELEEGFGEHELAVPLARRLKGCVDRAWAEVRLPVKPPIKPKTDTEPNPVYPGGGTVTASLVSEKAIRSVTPAEARKALEEALESADEGCRVDITWKIWKDE
ncbi:MAG: phage resistance protein [Vulcanimicrobiota bacterium]